MIYMNILRRLIFYANFLQANYSNFLIVWIYHTAKWVCAQKNSMYVYVCGPSIHWNICLNTQLKCGPKVEKKCKSIRLNYFFFIWIYWTWGLCNNCKNWHSFWNLKPTTVLFWFQLSSDGISITETRSLEMDWTEIFLTRIFFIFLLVKFVRFLWFLLVAH